MTNRELLWHQYSQNVELFKYYLKLVVEFNVFFYGITGAVVSYYLAHASEHYMRHALLLPFAMSALFAGFFIYGAILVPHLRREVFAIRDKLGLQASPDLNVLTVFLGISATLMLAVFAGLGFLMWCANIT